MVSSPPTAPPRRSRRNAAEGFHALAESFEKQFPKTLRAAETFLDGISDLRFTDTNRVPFPFQKLVRERLNVASLATASEGPSVVDLDGNKTLDVSGSYGVNVCGYDNYKRWMEEGWEATKNLGPVLGPLHPIVGENLAMIKAVSKLDEVSFHMSGTEAIMCAVRLAAFNKRRKLVVCFAGAYHGWWDGVQPGPGNERKITDVLPLKDMSPASLAAIKARASEIACVVVNPLQGFNPNSPPPNDLVLMTSAIRKAASNETMDHYAVWLKTLRALCTECDVPLVFDEVYTGFRSAPGGAQEYYGVNADMVVYGKTLGGGMPVGVVCGKKELMRRFDPEHPLRVSYVIGTFSALPLTMGSMNAFLKWATSPRARDVRSRRFRVRRLDQRHERRVEEGEPSHLRAQPHHCMDHHLRPARAVPLDAPVLPSRRGHRALVGRHRAAARFPGLSGDGLRDVPRVFAARGEAHEGRRVVEPRHRRAPHHRRQHLAGHGQRDGVPHGDENRARGFAG